MPQKLSFHSTKDGIPNDTGIKNVHKKAEKDT